MGSTLARWQDSIVAFDDMLDTRERAYAERVPQADAVLSLGASRQIRRGTRAWPAASSTRSRRRRTWRRSAPPKSANSGRASCVSNPRCSPRPNDEDTNVIREKTRLAKGVLYWRLAESFKARVWNERRTLKDLDQASARSADALGPRAEGARLHA